MASFGRAGETQPGFVFGNTEVILERKTEPSSTEMVLLRRSSLSCVPDWVLRNSLLKYLCLEGNQISDIPGSMFCSLPQLQWLDLRKNLITSLPAEIGSHRSLRNLLLEANPISELPPELGNVVTLRGLILRDCPIQFPPKEVLHQGCRSILRYLRTALTQREVSERKSLPAEERLQLPELTWSGVGEQDESADEDGLQRFKELKDELILLEKAEVASIVHGDKSRLISVAKRKGSSSKTIPKLHLLGSQCCAGSESRGEALQRGEHSLPKDRKKAPQKGRKPATTRGRQRKEQEADSKCPLEGSKAPSEEQMFGFTSDRSVWELERHIRAHAKRMQERQGKARGSVTQQATEEDVEEIRKLQARLLERKHLRRRSGTSFTFYSADAWPSVLFK